MSRAVDQYLQRYAEPEARLLPKTLYGEAWDAVVVVPCYGESDLVAGCLDSLRYSASQHNQRVVILLVVNCKNEQSKLKQLDNEKLFARYGTPAPSSRPLISTLNLDEHCCLAMIDRSSAGREFSVGQGVGLARKLGCDCALALWSSGNVKQPWIYTTDADVRVVDDYLAPRSFASGVASINVNFEHVPIDAESLSWKALAAYELSLHYYVRGLAHAQSQYAFHTIGSTIVVSCTAYAAVRGFPKRLAGEDFHILNKLAKVGTIASCHRRPLKILDRPSDRVPFGTGAAVTKITGQFTATEPYTFYHPDCFDLLKLWLERIKDYRLGQQSDHPWITFAALSQLPEQVLKELDTQLGITTGLCMAATQAKSNALFQTRMLTWFDALKQLRFVHILRDHHLKNLPYEAALTQASWAKELVSDLQVYQRKPFKEDHESSAYHKPNDPRSLDLNQCR